MQENIYVDLTRQFNEGRLHCILSSGQAVVMHKLAIMSKDGDWIVCEEAALDAERRQLMRVNENRLAGYSAAAKPWVANWSALERRVRDLPLSQAHTMVIAEAEKLLPFGPSQV